MRRFELTPSRALQQDIQCIWAVEELSITTKNEVIFPDPYRELVFQCGSPMTLEISRGVHYDLPRIYLNDLQSISMRFKTKELPCLIGVRFFPWSSQAFFEPHKQIPGTSLRLLSGIWQELAAQIEYTVRDQGVEAAMQALDTFLTASYSAPQSDQVIVSAARELLSAQNLSLTIQEIAYDVSLSVSQFERRFRRVMGVSPKMLSRLVRFEAICDSIWQNPKQPLSDLAASFGYADQAHFAHDFKAFAAETPRTFASRVQDQPV